MINYDSVLSSKIKEIKPSGIRKFFDLAAAIDNVISLGVGEPDFQTPWAIRKAAIDTLEKKRIIYTANSGLADLRCEISQYINKKLNVKYDPEHEIIVTGY